MARKVFLFLIVATVLYAIYWFAIKRKEARPERPRQESVKLKKHSERFNQSTDSLVNAYLSIKNAFIESDTAGAKRGTANLIAVLDNFPVDDLKNDSAMVMETIQGNLTDLKSNAESLLKQTRITEMRQDFSAMTEVMYPSFFTAINYEGSKLYLINCPMAFNDDVSANWISNTAEILNPYLGKDHPKYKAGMLKCGEVKDSVVAK